MSSRPDSRTAARVSGTSSRIAAANPAISSAAPFTACSTGMSANKNAATALPTTHATTPPATDIDGGRTAAPTPDAVAIAAAGAAEETASYPIEPGERISGGGGDWYAGDDATYATDDGRGGGVGSGGGVGLGFRVRPPGGVASSAAPAMKRALSTTDWKGGRASSFSSASAAAASLMSPALCPADDSWGFRKDTPAASCARTSFRETLTFGG